MEEIQPIVQGNQSLIRNKQAIVRLNDREDRIFKKAARLSCNTLSAWMRSSCLLAAKGVFAEHQEMWARKAKAAKEYAENVKGINVGNDGEDEE